MASKKYIGKTCAYCRAPQSSVEPDHVVAREFFFIEDRAHLPKVPVCRECNDKKARLEHYLLTVLPLGSQLPDARQYTDKFVGPRLTKNAKLRDQIKLNMRQDRWELQTNGLMLPAGSIKFDTQKLIDLLGYIVAGLFRFHWKDVLDPQWYVDVQIIDPMRYQAVSSTILPYFQDPAGRIVENLGRGTFRYQALRSKANLSFSLWEFNLLGGMEFAGDSRFPQRGFSNIQAVTRPTKAALAA
jgi:hypothetical protein